ncbi:hypothetical protein OG500_11520 [Kitasatospora sp. NBC_01250]|uniref:hypothetical protein n=1 Tax=Kitasatospora sp. NBC_01250 TaxID=2903571 RepID=UPI002E2F45C1|nr:hypothetical protein [Kitasatospora sp. NBC_01250]
MRPSYDGDHPVAPTPTPIYDELYSEYRRLFRALPGDRSGEEDLRFTGFAVRERPFPGSHASAHLGPHSGPHAGSLHAPHLGQLDGYRDPYGSRTSLAADHQFAAFPHHQAFPTHAGQPAGAPQFVPQQQAVHHQTGHQQFQNTGYQPHPAHHQPHQQHQNPQQHQPNQHQHQHPQGQASTGQGWVAAGYLSPVAAPAPAAPAPATPGRHRGALLSLPPGRS